MHTVLKKGSICTWCIEWIAAEAIIRGGSASALFFTHLFNALLALFAEISELCFGLLALLANKRFEFIPRIGAPALTQLLIRLQFSFKKSLWLLAL